MAKSLEDLKNHLEELVEQHQGLKQTELVAFIDKDYYLIFSSGEIINAISLLVTEKRIVEIEYTIPSRSYRTKSFLLPAGSFYTSSMREIGRKGAETRKRNLSPQRRAEIARKAANARWSRPT